MVVPPQDSIGENAVMPSRTESSTQNGQLASRSVQDVDTGWLCCLDLSLSAFPVRFVI